MRRSLEKIKRSVGRLARGVQEGEAVVSASPVVSVREVFRRFWPYARPYRRWIPVMLLLVALGPAFGGRS